MSDEPNTSEVVLETRNVTKRFPGVLANDDVSMKLHRGEILALLGENGAGKSTLMNIIYGLYHQDEGEVLLKDQEVRFASPREAIHSGIGMVHQHFQLVDVMTVAENVVLGEEKEAPAWRTIFSVLFGTLLGMLTFGLIVAFNNPLVYSTFTFGLLIILGPWVVSRFVLQIIGSISDNVKASIQPFRRGIIYFVQILAFFSVALAASNVQALDSEFWVAIVGMMLFIGAGYFIPIILSRNPYQERLRKPLSQYLQVKRETFDVLTIFVSLLVLAGVGLLIVAVMWLISQLADTSTDASRTLEFLLWVQVAIAGSALVALVLSWVFSWMFQSWDQVTKGLRVTWGLAWRIGLVLVALWAGNMARQVSEMAIVTRLMQTDRPFTIENTRQAGLSATATGKTEFALQWRSVERTGDRDQQITRILELIDEAFYREETIEVSPGLQTHVAGYDGLSTTWREAVDNVPLTVRDIIVVSMLIAFSVVAVRTWRGSKPFPGDLTSFRENDPLKALFSDYLLMILICVFYIAMIVLSAEHIDTLWKLIFVAVGTLIIGLTFIRTIRNRQQDPDRIRPVTPLDTVIDALMNWAYTIFSVRNTRQAAERVQELSRQYGLEVDPDVVVEKLPVGLQQRVEIIKALYRRADILILDEPTAVLTPQEGKELFKIMRELAAQGVSIIFITHKLKEVFEVATNIVVMRNGAVVGATTPSEATEGSLAAMMVGREVLLRVDKTEAHPEDVVLRVENLEAIDDRGAVALNRVSFDVRAGEVLGVAGVQGNGQSELVEVLTGLRPMSEGAVELLGQELKPRRHPDASLSQRIWSVVIDLGVVAVFTALVSYFWSYFSNDLDNFSLISLQTAIIFLVLDAVYTLTAWQWIGATFGKGVMSLQVVDAPSDRQPNFLQLGLRYLAHSLVRYLSPVFVPAAALLAALLADERPYSERLQSILYWYDSIPAIRCRVINRILITPRQIKDLRSSHVPEDRHRFGLVKPFTVAENLILNDYYEQPHAQPPSRLQVPGLSAVYVMLFGSIFAILGYAWLYVWNSSLWDDVLTRYGVPDSGLRTVPIDQGMTSLQRNYLNDPLVLSLGILLALTLGFSVLAYLLTKAVLRFVGNPFGVLMPLAMMAGGYVVLLVGNAVADIAGVRDFLALPFINLMASIRTDFATEINQAIQAVAGLLLLIVIGGLYNWVTQKLEQEPALVQRRQRLAQSRVGQFLEMQNAQGLTLNIRDSLSYTGQLIQEYDIRTPSPLVAGGSLSGGNQQKLVVAREFSRLPRLLIASQPTRGIDVGSIEFIHKRIIAQRDKGAAVLLVSAELDEVMSLADRIAVMYKGQIVKIVEAGTASREKLGLLMAGIVDDH